MTSRYRDAPGRNSPCPCGSGVKYKKCCLPAKDSPAARHALKLAAERVAHDARIAALRAWCAERGLDFEEEIARRRKAYEARSRGRLAALFGMAGMMREP